IPADSTTRWVEKAWFTNNNNIRITQGNSSPQGTSYTYANVHSADQPNSPYTLTVQNGQPMLGLKNSKEPTTEVDTATMHIAIYADNNTTDANYLKAALQAVN